MFNTFDKDSTYKYAKHVLQDVGMHGNESIELFCIMSKNIENRVFVVQFY